MQTAQLQTKTKRPSSVWRSLSAVHLKGEDREMAGKTTKTQLAVRDEREKSELRLVKAAWVHVQRGSRPLCSEVLHPHKL